MIRDQSQAHNTISIEVLAGRVARMVRRFLQVSPLLDSLAYSL